MVSNLPNIMIDIPLEALIYRSRAAIEITPLILTGIVDVSVHNNRRNHVTGMLLFDNENFVQYLEGPPRNLAECYRRICNDTRHRDVELMMQRSINERATPKWDMKLLHELPGQSAVVGSHELVDYFRAAA